MKSLIIRSFSTKVSSYSPPLPDSSSSLVIIMYHASKHKQIIQTQHNIGRFKENFILSHKLNTKRVASAISDQPVVDPDPQHSLPNAFYRFSRPHTVIGTAFSIVSVSLLAVQKLSDLSPLFFIGVLEAIVAAFFMNIYIVGLNQLCDIDIDKVVIACLRLHIVHLDLALVTSEILIASQGFLLGTAYSINIPMLRWKRFALMAAIVHSSCKSYSSSNCILPAHSGKTPLAINNQSLSLSNLDLLQVFWICILLLEVAYGVAILVGASSSFLWSKCITVLSHAILGLILWRRAKSTDLESKTAITSFYMFIWQLFYVEYLLIPLVRWFENHDIMPACLFV
ncbi:hypothetical protein L1987_49880 [Smallanthus sonchifolius]|uniref:Uncharacterized protein n=1 Tax=Smallanthus sonchifolius TaxID=185202 RepID=A0ACB9FVX7_9ASTR|nr:hypothetical protein L1987_49880 [Smallanthus sonchifolius]